MRIMGTVIIVVLIAALCVIGAISYAKRLSHGCCGTGGSERKVTKNADLSEYKYQYSVKIGGMSCKNCAVRIENAFNRQEGIYARADFKTGISEISAKEPVSDFELRKTILGLGYSVEEIKNK